MKLLAFAASSSKQSINKQLATYAANYLVETHNNIQSEVLDLNDYELPLFSQDKEQELGQPELAVAFLDKITQADAIIISFAEHNGSYTAAYKNLFDWCSRINPKVFQNKPMVLLATSPGGRGGASVLAAAMSSTPHFDGDVKASMSLPSFHQNFDTTKGIIKNEELNEQFINTIQSLIE